MKIQKSTTKESEILLTVTLEESEVKKYLDKASKELSKQVSIKGFRKGHVPANVLEKHYGKDVLVDFMYDQNLSEIYQKALIEEKIQPLSSPSVDLKDKENHVIEFKVATTPKVDTSKLSKVKVDVKTEKVSKKDKDQELENQLQRFQEVKEVERASKNGDEIVINFEGFDKDGKSVANTKGENYPLKLGSSSFIPGFEEGLVGAKKADKKDLDLEFPKDYHAKELQGAKITFKVEVLKVNEISLPELTEELVEKISHKKQSVEEFKKELDDRLEKRAEAKSKAEAEDKLYSEFLKNAEVVVSPLMIRDEKVQLTKELEQNAQRMHMPFESYKQALETKEGKSFDEFTEAQSLDRVKLRFIIQELMKEHKIEVSDEDLEKEIETKSKEAPKEIQDQVKEYYKTNPQAKEVLRNTTKLEKLLKNYM